MSKIGKISRIRISQKAATQGIILMCYNYLLWHLFASELAVGVASCDNNKSVYSTEFQTSWYLTIRISCQVRV